jgi:hypothetical protein
MPTLLRIGPRTFFIGLWTLLGVSEADVMEAAGFDIDRSSVRS